jgi:hypothetical protein
MKDIIRKILREQVNRNELEKTVRNEILQIKERNPDGWNFGCNLFYGSEKEWCRNIAMREIRKPSRKKDIQDDIDLFSLELKQRKEDGVTERIKFYDENDDFFIENINNLNSLKEKISDCAVGKKSIESFEEKLSSMFVFVKEIEDQIQYDELTKLNTNYSALSYLLTLHRRKMIENLSGMTKSDPSFDAIFHSYFLGSDDERQKRYPEFVRFLIRYIDGDDDSYKIMQYVYETIFETTEVGNASEKEVEGILNNLKEIKEIEDLKIFSGDFSFCDFLGVDMMIKLEGYWFPVQVKTKYDNCYGNQKFCKNLCVGKKGKKYIMALYDQSNIIEEVEI